MAEQKIIDVEPRHLKMVNSIFARNLPFKKVWAFGSRVKWTARPASDLDCVVFGATDGEISKAKEAFDESEVPFEVQLLNWENIPDDFKENIKKEYFVVREESDWGEFKLSDVAKEIRDVYQPASNGDHLYIGLEHIEQQSLRLNGVGHSSEIQSTKHFFRENDILFGSLRPYFRKVVKPKFAGVCSTDITVIRSIPEIVDQGFLYYLIASEPFIAHASNIANGSRMPRASWKVVSSFQWLIPSLPTQQKIASILSAYDDLIENNNRRIKILEEIARDLYREWFVNFKFPNNQNTKFVDSELGKIPEGWEVCLFSDELLIQNGFAFKSSEYSNKGTKLTRTKDFASSKYLVNDDIIFIPKELSSKYSNYFLKDFDFLLIMVGASIGKYGVVLKKDIPTLQNQNMWAIRPRNRENLKQWIILMMPNLIESIAGFATGAAREFFRKEHFNNLKIVVPSDEIIISFSEIVNNIFEEISALLSKNQNLRKTRDLLLPRLISGELSVENLEVKI